jgi:hypothetical protein
VTLGRAARERPPWLFGAGLALAAVLAGLVAGTLVAGGHATSVIGLALVVLPIVLWMRPETGPVVILLAALTIEQDPYMVGTRNGAFTDHIPLFHGQGGAHVNPADLLLLGLAVIWVLRRDPEAAAVARSRRSPLATAMLAVLGAVAVGVAVGIAHHGNVRMAMLEVRPYVYLAVTFFLASALITRSAVKAILWAFILGSGFKAAQGLLIFVQVRNMVPRPEAVLGHEEALFFAIFVLLTVALWLFEVPGALRTTATWLLPVVLAADLGNSRRTAWLELGAGLLVLLIIGFAVLPARRRFLGRLLMVMAVVSAVYLPAFWNKTGGLAQPARAIHSMISPDPRDAASNLYRIQEDANLKLNIHEGGLLGRGFGVPIDYALPIVDISALDPLIAYIPHNGVLYIPMRMGVAGAIAFWSLLAAGLVTACRLARSRDRELAVLGALTACALIAYALQGYNDQGFFFYRIAFVMGTLLGVVHAATRWERAREEAAA